MRPLIEDRNIAKKYSLAELVLFLIFAAGVLISLMIVKARGRIDLSQPIALPHSGLAAPVPVGPGWESADAWVYEPPDRFVLVGILRTGVQTVASVQYRYLLAAEGVAPADFLERTAMAANRRIVRRGRIVDGLEMEWVQLTAVREVADTIVGFAQLPQGRALVVHVRTPGDHLLANRLFRTLVQQVEFVPQEEIAADADFVGRMRASGLSGVLQQSGEFEGESVFLINDSFDRPRGFQIAQFRQNADTRDWGLVKAERVHYIAGTQGSLSKSYFECSDTFERYIWQTRRGRLRPGGGGASVLELAADGTLRISGGMLLQDVTCRPAIAVPEVLSGQAARAFLDAPEQDVIFDVMFDDGSILPARVSAGDCSQDPENSWVAAYCVRFEYLDGREGQRFYFDGQRRLMGRIDGRRRALVWEIADRRRLAEAFGDLNRFVGVESPAE